MTKKILPSFSFTFTLLFFTVFQGLTILADPLVIYSGRSKELIGPLIEQFRKHVPYEVHIRYGKTAGMAALILEEGKRSPADIFFAQDAGALGALEKAKRFAKLPESILQKISPRFRSRSGLWVGISGRARVVVYNSSRVKPAELPDSITGFCEAKWKDRIGWAPMNGSFQAFITALRVLEGDNKTRQWLTCIQQNNPNVYPKNTPIVAAVGAGEIDVGFVNHYYLYRFLAEFGKTFPAKNYHPRSGKAGALINVAGIGILSSSPKKQQAEAFLNFLLLPSSQRYFTNKTYEYPLVEGITINPVLPPLDTLALPDVDLSNLEDLQGTLHLLQNLGIL